jgi:predicted amidohydrolase YtcJ
MNGSRRSLIKALAAVPLTRLYRETPELVLYNGRIWTVSDGQPEVQAIAIAGGRIQALGTNHDVLALSGANTRKLDLDGQRVLPGFIDAHAHPAVSGLDHLTQVACDKNSIAAILEALRAKAQGTEPGAWVQGFLYDDAKTPRPLNRRDLDGALPGHPVVVHHRGGHTGFVNSLALSKAGVDNHTPDPPGGRYEHGADGELTGFVADAALNRIDALIPKSDNREAYRAAVGLISGMFNRRGITSACDADTPHQALRAYQDARDAGDLTMRIYCHITRDDLPRLIEAGIHTGLGDSWVRVGGVKQYADGSISERTAWLSAPYEGIPGFTGLALASRESLYATARQAWDAGFQLATHANGDLAIDRVLGIYEQLMAESPRRGARPRLEHCTLVNDSLIARMRAIGAVPVPFAGYVYFHGDVLHFYGEERTRHMFAMRSLLDAGLRPASSSDYTASPADPLLWLQSQVTRTDMAGHVWGANQRISVAEAIRCATMNGAYASFEEHAKGSLEPGKLADLVVLKQDPFHVDPGALAQIAVERTMVEGRWVYES